MEYKSTKIEVKDINAQSRTAVIAYATYNNIDKYGDIVRPGAFTKTISENKSDIRFFLNHDPWQAPGKPLEFSDDATHAIVKVSLGTHTLGEDTLKMMAEGIITDASFGFQAIRYDVNDSKEIRELKEVKLFEVSALTSWGANPLSKIQTVTKNFAPQYAAISERLVKMEKFCRDGNATDKTFELLLKEISLAKKSLKLLIDTDGTHDDAPPSSVKSTNEIQCPECGEMTPDDPDADDMVKCIKCAATFKKGQKAWTDQVVRRIKLLTLKM